MSEFRLVSSAVFHFSIGIWILVSFPPSASYSFIKEISATTKERNEIVTIKSMKFWFLNSDWCDRKYESNQNTAELKIHYQPQKQKTRKFKLFQTTLQTKIGNNVSAYDDVTQERNLVNRFEFAAKFLKWPAPIIRKQDWLTLAGNPRIRLITFFLACNRATKAKVGKWVYINVLHLNH